MTFCGTTGKETRIEENEIPRPNATEPEGGFQNRPYDVMPNNGRWGGRDGL
jgi:hypothetical protein